MTQHKLLKTVILRTFDIWFSHKDVNMLLKNLKILLLLL